MITKSKKQKCAEAINYIAFINVVIRIVIMSNIIDHDCDVDDHYVDTLDDILNYTLCTLVTTILDYMFMLQSNQQMHKHNFH